MEKITYDHVDGLYYALQDIATAYGTLRKEQLAKIMEELDKHAKTDEYKVQQLLEFGVVMMEGV